MFKKRTLIATAVITAVITAAGLAASVSSEDTKGQSDFHSKTANVDLIFADGFESGDTSAWDDLNSGSCTITSITLPVPTPVRRKK